MRQGEPQFNVQLHPIAPTVKVNLITIFSLLCSSLCVEDGNDGHGTTRGGGERED